MKDYLLSDPIPKDNLDLLLYEIRMFENSFPVKYSPKDYIDKNVRLESFLLHARNLIYFLEDNGQQDDILASQFKDINGETINGTKLPLSVDIKLKINKHLAHLTKARLKEKPYWNIYKIKKSINGELMKFIAKVSDIYFPTTAKRTKKDFEAMILNKF